MSRSFRRNFSSFFDNFQSHSRSHFQKIFIESNFKFLKIIFKFLFQILSNFINFLKIIMNPLLYFSSKKRKRFQFFVISFSYIRLKDLKMKIHPVRVTLENIVVSKITLEVSGPSFSIFTAIM